MDIRTEIQLPAIEEFTADVLQVDPDEFTLYGLIERAILTTRYVRSFAEARQVHYVFAKLNQIAAAHDFAVEETRAGRLTWSADMVVPQRVIDRFGMTHEHTLAVFKEVVFAGEFTRAFVLTRDALQGLGVNKMMDLFVAARIPVDTVKYRQLRERGIKLSGRERIWNGAAPRSVQRHNLIGPRSVPYTIPALSAGR